MPEITTPWTRSGWHQSPRAGREGEWPAEVRPESDSQRATKAETGRPAGGRAAGGSEGLVGEPGGGAAGRGGGGSGSGREPRRRRSPSRTGEGEGERRAQRRSSSGTALLPTARPAAGGVRESLPRSSGKFPAEAPLP